MICPQTQAECQYNCDYLMQRQCSFTPPPPTLAEIERLVDEYGLQSSAGGVFREQILEAKAALMAAIRAYGRE